MHLRAEMMEEVFTEGMDPGGGGCRGKELEEVGFREGWSGLGAEGCGFLGHAVEFAAEASDLIEGGRGSGVKVHVFGAREGVRVGVIGPAVDQLPGPNEFCGLVGWATKELGEGSLGGLNVDTSRYPACKQAGNIAREFSGGNAAAPGSKDIVGKGAQGGGNVRARLGAGFLFRGCIWRGTATKPGMHSDGGTGGDTKVAEGNGGANRASIHRQVDV